MNTAFKTNTVLKWAGWFLLCAVLQSTVVPHIAIFSVMPDLLLLALFSMAIKAGVMPGVYVGFFLGLGLDLFSPSMLGQNALAMSVTGFICGLFNERVMRLDPMLRTVLLLGAFVANDTVVMAVHILSTKGEMGIIPMELLAATLPRALYTLIFATIPFIWTNFIRPPRLSGSG